MILKPLSDPNWISARVFEARALAEKYRRTAHASPVATERVYATERAKWWDETAEALEQCEHDCRLAILAGQAA